jgi:hypothetical protein
MNIHRLKDGSAMKSREELYKLKLARLQKEENFFDQLHAIHSETLRCLPCVTPEPQNISSLQHLSSLGENQTKFITALTEKTDPVIHLPRVLPPVTRAHLPSASLRYFIHLKKKNDEGGVREDEGEAAQQQPNEKMDRQDEMLIGREKSFEETGTERRQRLKKAESLAPQSRGYATKKTATPLLSSVPASAPAVASQLPPLSPQKISSSLSLNSLSSPSSLASPSPAYYNPPSWLSMPQLSHLSESIHSNKLISLELVSHVPSLAFSRSKFHLHDSLFTIGTSPTCDCIVSVDASLSSLLETKDPRQICHISSIHSVISFSLISEQYQHHDHRNSASLSVHASMSHLPSHPPDPSSSPSSLSSRPKPNSVSVSVVDNHTLWGTYVVTMSGVQKVSTVVTKGYSLQNGDLLCLGLIRNGPKTMPSVDANKAMAVFRVRIE